MMPVLGREPLQPHDASRSRCSRPQDRWRRKLRRRMVDSAGFTLVEVVVSSSILAFALASSFRGWSQGQALVQQANQRQGLLDAVEQDLQRQQGFVVQKLKAKPPWACEMPLAELKEQLSGLASHDLPDTVERQWLLQGQPPVLAIRYTSPNLQSSRERLLALGGGSVCE
ncbi:MAG: type II secretion system protein [Cyanobacteria bacterium MAG CAR4_bin_6]|nr:type II secretion system protein [Cyanobacteria bacterium MAG CAR4_bin_6]